ncbi:hypothetical protein OEZ85_013522 [Tetradesmus obliquus]|uniref:Arf-GAP domain-containing protein n=1 Tax=Tetradesmus obliquus TaxID=3088 RepID=A0ABY8UQK5_TETOB|nr:hypothetical protein OEZ85_013522 [Tetradesmus obliquus]
MYPGAINSSSSSGMMAAGGGYYIPPGGNKAGLGERVAEVTREGYTWLRDYCTAIKYGRLHPFTTVERKAREATRKDPWGPTGLQLAELADLSHNPEHCYVIFAVLEFRLSRGPEKWRNVYKALLALEFLLVRGSTAAVQLAGSRELQTLLRQLVNFETIGHRGIDCGSNVRIRAAAVLELLQDPQLLQQRRSAAADRLRALSPTGLQQQQQYSSSSSSSYAAAGRDPFVAAAAAPAAVSTNDMYNNRYNSQYNSSYAGGSAGSGSAALLRPGGSSSAAGSGFAAVDQGLAAGPGRGLAAGGGGFGEAKGVTFEENKLRVGELRQLLARPENRRCADCQDASPAGRPSWASVNLGVFICMRCAGTHRGLGAHISKVRSCTLDTWLPEQVVFMASTGNAAANAHFEALLPPADQNPTSSSSSGLNPGAGAGLNPGAGGGLNPGPHRRPARDSPDMAAFIRQKYIDQGWVKPGTTWPPSIQQQQQQSAAPVAATAISSAIH